MNFKYVLITAARNEEAYIAKTIQSVIDQTVLPQKWVIVSDRSTDHTNQIVNKFADNHVFIELTCIKELNDWNFASKVHAINAGYERIVDIEYDFIGILDADITFERNYYESVFSKFQQNHKLGICGGMISEWDGKEFQPLNYNVESVAGAVQLFRRQCYEAIGGYIPSKMGGIDAIAEIMARMNGWEVRSFPEIRALHHRRIGTTKENILRSKFRYGQRDYAIGNHPLFMILKCIDRFREKPYFIGGTLMMIGYGWSWVQNEPRPASESVVKYLRNEQMIRMSSFIQKLAKRSFK